MEGSSSSEFDPLWGAILRTLYDSYSPTVPEVLLYVPVLLRYLRESGQNNDVKDRNAPRATEQVGSDGKLNNLK
jgi:hypothetical protein